MKRASKHSQNQNQLKIRRHQVACEAARLLAVGGLRDYQQAKRKAAKHLGLLDDAFLPGDAEVQEQLRGYQRLFQSGEQPMQLQRRRQAAVQAMEFFGPFQPRLVGSVLDGTANDYSPILLQVFSDDPDAVARFVIDARMPTSTLVERRLRIDRQRMETFPCWSFAAEELAYEVVVLPTHLLRQAPLAGLDEKPMARATVSEVRALLDAWAPGSDAG